MASNAELQAEVQRLTAELEAARNSTASSPNNKPVATEPSFGLSEGQRAELEATGKTVSPFTGARQVGDGKPGEKPRTVSAEEYAKTPAKPASAK